MRKSYPSDLSRKQFEKIRPHLEAFRKSTKPRTVDLYDVFCGILYLLKSGCQWRMLPGDLPKWRTVHEYFRIWSKSSLGGGPSLLEQVQLMLIEEVRQQDSRSPQTSLLIIDAQSVKNADTAGEKGYDAGKKVSGIKRHLAVDTQGLPHAIHVTTANVTDRDAAMEMFQLHSGSLTAVAVVLADGNYTGENFATAVRELLDATVEIAKRSELHTFVVIPKRWVVERSFAWLDKCRRLWKNCERLLHTSLQMIVLAFLSLLLKRF
jgi:transposase